jgi:Domain of unknown function (DUF1707)
VIGTLKSAYVLGFVTKGEFDARVSQTLAARTYAELAVPTADLPAGLAGDGPRPDGLAAAGPRPDGLAAAGPRPDGLAAAGRPSARMPGRAPATVPARASLSPAERAIAATALLAAVSFAAAIVSSDGWLGLGAFGTALLSLFLAAVQLAAARRPRSPGGRPPAPRRVEAVQGAAAADPALEAPRATAPRRPAAEPRRRRPRPLLSS